ncbi:MAG: hypothetical protein Q8M94_10530, partial [Ignavibacteria bacterium]|nr:hypothetical protein [Ignavibacteria bacterium]
MKTNLQQYINVNIFSFSNCNKPYNYFYIGINKILILFFLSFTSIIFPQGPGFATNPNPPDSATAVFWFDKNISWINPPTTTAVKVNVGIHPDFLTELYSGLLITNFILPSPLDYRKTYYWRIDEVENTGITIGNTWLFTTQIGLYPVFIDSFNLGISNWNTINLMDSCDWEWKNFSGSNYYLPPTSKTYGIVFDKTSCLNNRSINVLELINPPSLVGYTRCGIGWDNDLMLGGNEDTAYVEVSKDGGLSWNKVWERFGRSQRKSQEEIWFLEFILNWDIKVRFYSSFEDSTSWWAIDNFYINATGLAFFQQIPPRNLQYFLNVGGSLNINILWEAGVGPPATDRYRVQRKFGDSLDQYAYFTIGETNLNTLSFIDDHIDSNSTYTYKISLCEGPIQGIESVPLTILSVPIPVELISFYALQNNELVELNWITVTELNNLGFHIEKSLDKSNWYNIGFVEGKGTTTELNYYSYIDSNLIQVEQFYRLKQVDYNGSFKYSNIISSIKSTPDEFNLILCYPNPFNNSTTIQFILDNDEPVQLLIYNSLGELINKLY